MGFRSLCGVLCQVALFVHRGVNYPDVSETQGQHLLVVFAGGADGQPLPSLPPSPRCLEPPPPRFVFLPLPLIDSPSPSYLPCGSNLNKPDRLALSLSAQMCRSPGVTATVIRVSKDTSHTLSSDEQDHDPLTPSSSAGHTDKEKDIKEHETAMTRNQFTVGRSGAGSRRIGGGTDTEQGRESNKADDLAWGHFSSSSTSSSSGAAAHGRMVFHLVSAAKPLSAIVQRAHQATSSTSPTTGNRSLVVVTGRGRGSGQGEHAEEVASILASQGHNPGTGAEMRKTLGDVATAVVVAGPSASFLVVQAEGGEGGKGLEA